MSGGGPGKRKDGGTTRTSSAKGMKPMPKKMKRSK